MNKLKTILKLVGTLILVGGVIAISYYIYESIYFFSTEDAQVTADTVTLTPEITGKLKEWNVEEGDYIKAGQIIGKQDLSNMISSTAVNPQALNSSADAVIAKADIKSPIDGKIVQSDVVKGQVISPGMEIATIADTSHMYIKANIEETNILHIKPGETFCPILTFWLVITPLIGLFIVAFFNCNSKFLTLAWATPIAAWA